MIRDLNSQAKIMLITSSISNLVGAIYGLYYMIVWIRLLKNETLQIEGIISTILMFIVGYYISYKNLTKISLRNLIVIEALKYFYIPLLMLEMWDIVMIIMSIHLGIVGSIWNTFNARLRACNVKKKAERIQYTNIEGVVTMGGSILGYCIGANYLEHIKVWKVILCLELIYDIIFLIKAYLIKIGKLSY